MPFPGQINNPGGVNGLYESEAPYGAIKRRQQMTQAAPLPPNRAINTPRRAQRSATKLSQAIAQQQAPAAEPLDPMQQWAAIAAIPGASPLVRDYALRASRGPR